MCGRNEFKGSDQVIGHWDSANEPGLNQARESRKLHHLIERIKGILVEPGTEVIVRDEPDS
jgi:hypothetical protein